MLTDVQRVIARVTATYAGCTSYQDEGIVTTTFFGPAKRTERRPFSTRFVRSAGFRFEFRSRRGEDDWDQYAIWVERDRPCSWWSIRPGREPVESLGRGLAAATGVSGGSAYRVPHLLMPDLGKGSLFSGPSVAVIDVPEAAAQNCMIIEESRGSGMRTQAWIDTSSFLIRRVAQLRHVLSPPPLDTAIGITGADPDRAKRYAEMMANFSAQGRVEVESITTYDAAFNVEIPLTELLFALPID